MCYPSRQRLPRSAAAPSAPHWRPHLMPIPATCRWHRTSGPRKNDVPTRRKNRRDLFETRRHRVFFPSRRKFFPSRRKFFPSRRVIGRCPADNSTRRLPLATNDKTASTHSRSTRTSRTFFKAQAARKPPRRARTTIPALRAGNGAHAGSASRALPLGTRNGTKKRRLTAAHGRR